MKRIAAFCFLSLLGSTVWAGDKPKFVFFRRTLRMAMK